MSHKKQPDGCSKMLRRTFLLLVGVALFKGLSLVFSYAENRAFAWNLLRKLAPKLTALLPIPKPSVTPQPLPNAPLPKTSVTPQPLPSAPLPKSSLTPQPLPSNPPLKPLFSLPKKGRPVEVKLTTVEDVSFYQTTIDLTDPQTFITIGLANNAAMANSAQVSKGDESFEKLVSRHPAAVVANGTFFGKDTQKAVLGNMVASGRFLKYSRWENYGTTLGLRAGNVPEMITARIESQPEWNQQWFSITCGPRLLKDGKIWIVPKLEGFKDPNVLGEGYRTAIGFPDNKKQLFLITFLASLSLQKEAEIMKAIGCREAMNLDGGASEALAHNGEILISAGRPLTNVIVVYDTNYPAPRALQESWVSFQKGDRPSIPTRI